MNEMAPNVQLLIHEGVERTDRAPQQQGLQALEVLVEEGHTESLRGVHTQ